MTYPTSETARVGQWGRDSDGTLVKLDRYHDHKTWECATLSYGSWGYYGDRIRLSEIDLDLTPEEIALCQAADAHETRYLDLSQR